MHIGNLRTALYTYLIAKQNGGEFILRIEDTDRARYVDGAVDVIYRSLELAGLKWDEGPDKGGDYGPYLQSERMQLYGRYALQLIEHGSAYRCFCAHSDAADTQSVDLSGSETFHNPADKCPCRNLTDAQVSERTAAGETYVIRQKMPLDGTVVFTDEIYGEIETPCDTLDDQVLIKSDGMPTYNFANVIDDHLMEITHIVRGNEYLSSTPKYNLLYKAFGWDIPVYIHCAHVMKDKNAKLSKRDGHASFEDLLALGFLPEAVVNYTALLGWAPKTENEFFTLEELVNEFSIDGMSKSPAIFDMMKLKAFNAEYIRRMSLEQFMDKSVPIIKNAVGKEIDCAMLCKVLQPRTELFTDIAQQVDFIAELPDYDIELYTHKKMKTNPEIALDVLKRVLPLLQANENWTEETVHEILFGLIEEMGVKNGVVLWSVRTALAGKPVTPGGAAELCVILGKEESVERIRKGIFKLSQF
jgi:glutamyl-tRNA synthetase